MVHWGEVSKAGCPVSTYKSRRYDWVLRERRKETWYIQVEVAPGARP